MVTGDQPGPTMPQTDKSVTARIEVFRPGTFTPMQGGSITYSAADLRAMADAYDPQTAPAPIVIGHPETNAPAYGWVERFDYDATAERLFADVHEIEPAFAEMVKAGRFKKVSMEMFGPASAHNPVPGAWYPKHVGFLGAAAPAVAGLKNVQFAAGPGFTFEAAFAAPGISEAAGLFRALRDFLIERFGLDEADKALPTWQIEWLGQQDAQTPSYTAPQVTTPVSPVPNPEEEPAVNPQPDPAFAARETELTARETRIADREAQIRRADHVSFAERMVQEGRLLPASKEKIVAILDALPATEAVSFSEGGTKLTPGDALREVLEAQPKVVSFGALDLPDNQGTAPEASFAADGKAVDPVALARHQKALNYQRTHPGTEYLDAVRAVS